MKRQCGDCQLCCKVMPVRELNKPGNTRCTYQKRGVGCSIYANRPPSCRHWNCRWLLRDDTDDLSRPDRSAYVIDLMPDYVTLRQETGETIHIPVLQVWVDPARPDAWRKDRQFYAYVARQGKTHGMGALIRNGEKEALVLFPPAVAADHEWHEMTSSVDPEKTHTLADMERLFKVDVVVEEH